MASAYEPMPPLGIDLDWLQHEQTNQVTRNDR